MWLIYFPESEKFIKGITFSICVKGKTKLPLSKRVTNNELTHCFEQWKTCIHKGEENAEADISRVLFFIQWITFFPVVTTPRISRIPISWQASSNVMLMIFRMISKRICGKYSSWKISKFHVSIVIKSEFASPSKTPLKRTLELLGRGIYTFPLPLRNAGVSS